MEKEVAQVIELAGRGTGHVEYVRKPSACASARLRVRVRVRVFAWRWK